MSKPISLITDWREREWLRRACFQHNRDLLGILEDRRSFMQLTQQAQMLGGGSAGFALYYTGSSVGMWNGQGQLIFPPGGTWTFTVTSLVRITMKGCGPGGYGTYYQIPATTQTLIGGGGGGGAYNLGVGGVLFPRVTYTVAVPGPGTQAPMELKADGAVVFALGAGQNGAPAVYGIGGAGGTSSQGSPGGKGGSWNQPGDVNPGSTMGTGGGGAGGPGNNGCTGAWPGQQGGSGESGAGVNGDPPTACNGGDGGYGGGVVVGGQIYGRGGGGGGFSGSGEFDPNPITKPPVYCYLATGAVLGFSFAGF